MDRLKVKGRRSSGKFVRLPHELINSPNFRMLSGNAVKLLVQMMDQFRFGKGKGITNNGDLCASWSIMEKQGWKSKGTLQRARDELLHYGFIELTRLGHAFTRGWPNLYAVTLYAIDECGGKLEVGETRVPSGLWKKEVPRYKPPENKSRKAKVPLSVGNH
ncbi:hypothetical protein [Endozoicomonas montiporae]|uniref:Uncharacterized protein n=1 Tax=Endozoicomonas montiporae CL-33 TaxID=570277 RepID=A0A142BI50_9GAMM|nr:hypothetical protein [Endozoicomonas montiporae]AMO58426.1 hypothetical protein EZMO1_4513 [Endozoicomonas montiporae CL-33]